MFYRKSGGEKELTSATFTDKSAMARQVKRRIKKKKRISFFSSLFAFAYVRAA